MRKARIIGSMGVALAAALVGTLNPAAASGGGGPVAQQVLGSGSDTTQFMMSQLSQLYQFSPGCAQIPTPSGPTPWLDFSCQSGVPAGAVDPPAVTTTGTSVTGSSKLTVSSTTGIIVGQQVEGPGWSLSTWPQGVYVKVILSPTTLTVGNSPNKGGAVTADASAGSGTFYFSNVPRTENYEHDQMTSAYFLGSGNGITQLCDQGLANVAHIDYARSSRALKSSDCTGLHFVAYANDSISWEAFNVTGGGTVGMNNTTSPCNGGICLTQTQLQDIFVTCTITNWDQVGGANVTIDPYTPQPGSGTRSTFDSFLGGSSDTCINQRNNTDPGYAASHIIPENANTAIVANGDQANAIFPFSYGVWKTQVNGAYSSLLGQVDGQVPSSKSFPYVRALYNVYCGPTDTNGNPSQCAANTPGKAGSSAQTVAFVGPEGWICKSATGVAGSKTLTGHVVDPYSPTKLNFFTEIENTIKTQGFVPLSYGLIGGGDLSSDYCRLSNT